MEITEIQSILKELSLHHGNTQLQGIPDIANQKLAEILGNNYLDMTVKKAKEQLMHFFTNESLLLQEKKFEEACENHIIIKKNSKLEGNERLGLLKDYKLYELLQIAFSPKTHYFQIAPEAFTEFKGDIRELYKKAIDVMLIDPMKVSQSSLDALGIKQLDPDCQNLKEILKSMVSLKYHTSSGEEKYTPTINLTPDGKVITLSSQSVIYPATPPATQAEKNKKDVTVQMAVYKDLFSLIRRE